MDSAMVSVIVSGIVALSSLLVPIIIDWRKSNRGKTTVKIEKINSAALELLGHLSHFRHWVWGDIEASASGFPVQQVYTDMRVKHYAWEQAAWSHLDDHARERVRKLRRRFERLHTESDITKNASESDLPTLSDEILKLTHTAVKKLEK